MYQDKRGSGENRYGVVIQYSLQEPVGVMELSIWTRASIGGERVVMVPDLPLGRCAKTSEGAEKMGMEL
jgi:hypothetical protein